MSAKFSYMEFQIAHADVIMTKPLVQTCDCPGASRFPRSESYTNMPEKLQDSGKSYHLQCTGNAAETARAHSEKEAITLFGSCFCPFVQRVWIALEHLGIDYEVSAPGAAICRCS